MKKEKITVIVSCYNEEVSLPLFYKEMDKVFIDLGIELEDTDDKEKIMNAGNFISTFTPSKL